MWGRCSPIDRHRIDRKGLFLRCAGRQLLEVQGLRLILWVAQPVEDIDQSSR